MATLLKVLPTTYVDFNTTGDLKNSVFYPFNCMNLENSYSLWAPALDNRTAAEYKGFDFSSLPDDALIDSISVAIRYKYKNTTNTWQLRDQYIRKNGAKVGSTFTFYLSTLVTAPTYTDIGAWTVEELKDNQLGVFIEHLRTPTGIENYLYIYYMCINVEYHVLARPSLDIIAYSRSKIGKEEGINECQVQFVSDQVLTEWEARVDEVPDTQTGYLVGNGTLLSEGEIAEFTIEALELTEGDKEYTIKVYGKNADGVWSI